MNILNKKSPVTPKNLLRQLGEKFMLKLWTLFHGYISFNESQ